MRLFLVLQSVENYLGLGATVREIAWTEKIPRAAGHFPMVGGRAAEAALRRKFHENPGRVATRMDISVIS